MPRGKRTNGDGSRRMQDHQKSSRETSNVGGGPLELATSKIDGISGASRIWSLPTLSLPARFGKYSIEEHVGQGAMAAVFRAREVDSGRVVAIKFPHCNLEGSPSDVDRLFREARAAAAVSHPNICKILDCGVHNDQPFLVMEFVAGRPLTDFTRPNRRLLAAVTSAKIVRRLASALSRVHASGVVHRDVKPSNIRVNAKHEPVLLDFGLAIQEGDSRLTRAGALLGSPSYMSPEQARSDLASIGPRTDIYGLGTVLYELLTGRPPFEGAVALVLMRVLSELPQRVDEISPGVDQDLCNICHTMLAKKPDDRYPSMLFVVDVLSRWLKENSGGIVAKNVVAVDLPDTIQLDEFDSEAYLQSAATAHRDDAPTPTPPRSGVDATTSPAKASDASNPATAARVSAAVELRDRGNLHVAIQLLRSLKNEMSDETRALLAEFESQREEFQSLSRFIEESVRSGRTDGLREAAERALQIDPADGLARSIIVAFTEGSGASLAAVHDVVSGELSPAGRSSSGRHSTVTAPSDDTRQVCVLCNRTGVSLVISGGEYPLKIGSTEIRIKPGKYVWSLLELGEVIQMGRVTVLSDGANLLNIETLRPHNE